MQVSGDTIIIHFKKIISISVVNDYTSVNVFNEDSDLTGKFIMIGKSYYDIKMHNTESNKLTLTDRVKEEDALETTAELFFDKTDLIENEHFSSSKNCINIFIIYSVL